MTFVTFLANLTVPARLEEGLKHSRRSTADDWLEQSAHHQRVLAKQRLP